MFFKTIKSTTTSLNAITIFLVSVVVVFFAIQEHENLYREAVKNNLNGLSENMANDLIPSLASKDSFEVTNTLLRLDSYKNVKFAKVYDNKWQQIDTYIGYSDGGTSIEVPAEYLNTKNLTVQIVEDELIALKLIGDKRLPLGYLLIVHDSKTPLKESKIALLKDILPITIFFAVLMISISSILQQRLFLPLTRLSFLAKKIQQTKDYSLRITIKGKTEVAELSRNINNMMATINTETEINEKHTITLIDQQEKMEKLANFDSLTGLPNRSYFLKILGEELSNSTINNNNLSLIYLDLDGFKTVNDSLGHDTGDKLLLQVGERIKACLMKGDIISRIGGDEFLILSHNSPSNEKLINIASDIIDTINIPFKINDWEVKVGISIGIARLIDSGLNINDFISNADIAMYRSKNAGRNKYTLFLPSMMEENKRKILIANSISSAIKNNEFTIHYQGKVSPSEQLIGYEALIRWTNPTLGFVSPAEFIPIAEQSGKVIQITKWVIKQVFKDLKTLDDLSENSITISLNLSAHDIKNYSLTFFIKDLFKKYNIDPRQIEFEVTESAYLENFDIANRFLGELIDTGSSIALDDFGTGYSSLSYLTKIKLNTLKIDKQFIDNLAISRQSTVITKTVIEMAKQLNLRVCAEGVENESQADLLKAYGCDQMQGYYFHKPIPLESILLIANNKEKS